MLPDGLAGVGGVNEVGIVLQVESKVEAAGAPRLGLQNLRDLCTKYTFLCTVRCLFGRCLCLRLCACVPVPVPVPVRECVCACV